MLRRAKNFIKNDIWTTSLGNKSKTQFFLIKQLRVYLVAFKGFMEDRVAIQASALTYYTLLSVVPIVAMAFGVANGFGLEDKMEDIIYENFEGQEEVMNWIIDLSSNLLSDAEGGVLAGIGLIILIWSVMQVLTNIENSFNAIWQVKHARPFLRKMADYMSIMLIGPLMIILSSSVMVYISTKVQGVSDSVNVLRAVTPFLETLFGLVPYVLIWLLFTLIYIIMPNTKVKFLYALIAGIVAGTLFQLTQWAYINFQIGVSKYSALYGTFAALPLFLVWLQISWLIVLLGAEISFAYQNVSKFEYEAESTNISYHNKRLLSLLMMTFIVKKFEAGDRPLTSKEISDNVGIPLRLVREILSDMVTACILNETVDDTSEEDYGYQPSTDINKITVEFVNRRLDSIGTAELKISESKAFDKLSTLYESIYTMLANAPTNKLLKEI